MTLKQAAQSAIDVQDACNLSGVAHSMLHAITAIRDDASNTVQVNQHPIVTLFMLKMCELNGCGSTLHKTYRPAVKACIAIAAGLPWVEAPSWTQVPGEVASA